MKKNIFRIAIIQKCSNGKDCEENSAMICEAMHEAKAGKADIFLIPECFITGYDLPIENEEAIDDERSRDYSGSK